MKKFITSMILIFTVSVNSVSANILGSVIKFNSKLPVAKNTVLYQITVLSDQKGVGNQTEYYAKYIPNEDTIPAVVTGESIYGKRTIKEVIEYMKNNGMVPMIGINASYFSFQTGLPMGTVISDGIITSKDDRTLTGIGFKKDGSAFIEDMCIEINASFGEDYVLQIPYVNKLITKDSQILTMYTNDYADTTKTTTETFNIILKNHDGKLSIGEEFECEVSEILTTSESVKLKEDELVLTVNTNGNQYAILLLGTLSVGDKVNISVTANNEIWNEAYNALASEGERLLNNGEIPTNLPAGADPRTAVGITNSGEIIFYVIDGRQQGHSYGVKKETLAKRLKELGCVDAINLDGGGSTSIAGFYPGSDDIQIINSPSDGRLRQVTNFIFLKNLAKPTGVTENVIIYPYSKKILSGSTVNLTVNTFDEHFYYTRYNDVKYSVNEYAKITDDGKLTALGEGKIILTAEVEEKIGEAEFESVITPENIRIYNEEGMNELTTISVLPNEKYKLTAKAFVDSFELISQDEVFRWSLSDTSDAKISDDGELTISEDFVDDINLIVKAGSFEKVIPITLGSEFDNHDRYPYSKISVDGSEIIIDFYSKNKGVDKDNSFFKVDGKKIDFSECEILTDEKKHLKVKYTSQTEFHKINVQSTLLNGYTSVNTYKNEDTDFINIFKDTDDHWAKDIISYMNKEGIVNGSTENGEILYKPQNNVTRAEFAIMVSNYLGLDTKNYEDISLEVFVDEKDIPTWAKSYVKAVYSEKIINGKDNYGKLCFEPNSNISREEAITILSRMLPKQIEETEVLFDDKELISDWAYNSFERLISSGFVNGYEDNTIRPKNNVTRAEAVTLLYNIY